MLTISAMKKKNSNHIIFFEGQKTNKHFLINELLIPFNRLSYLSEVEIGNLLAVQFTDR